MAIIFDERTRDEITIDLIDKIRTRGIGITNFSTGSVIRCLVDIIADEVEDLNGFIKDTYNGFTIDNRVGSDLDLIGEALGIYRKSAKKAMGVVTFYTGDSPATAQITIPQGYTLSTVIFGEEETQYEFEVLQDTILEVGQSSVDVVVQSIEAGAVSIPIGNLSVMNEDLQGINSVMNQSPIISGIGIESDDAYREAIRTGNKAFGTVDAIREAVMQVNGVKNCWIQDDEDDLFKVVVAFETDDDTVNRTIVAPAVLDAVYRVKPVGVIPYLAEAEYRVFAITVSTNNSLTDLQQQEAKRVITEYVNGLKPYTNFYNAEAEMKLNNYLKSVDSNLFGVIKYGGVRSDIVADTDELFKLGTVTFNTNL